MYLVIKLKAPTGFLGRHVKGHIKNMEKGSENKDNQLKIGKKNFLHILEIQSGRLEYN